MAWLTSMQRDVLLSPQSEAIQQSLEPLARRSRRQEQAIHNDDRRPPGVQSVDQRQVTLKGLVKTVAREAFIEGNGIDEPGPASNVGE